MPRKKRIANTTNSDEFMVESTTVNEAEDTSKEETEAPISVFEGETFIFFIGLEKKSFVVHKNAFKNISEPLTYMMTNDKMTESIQGSVHLKDVEPAVFRELLRYAYIGVSGLLSGIKNDFNTSSNIGEFKFSCITRCFGKWHATVTNNDSYPFCSDKCHSMTLYHLKRGGLYMYCVYPGCSVELRYVDDLSTTCVLCHSHETTENREIYCDNNSTNSHTFGRKLKLPTSLFENRTYNSVKYMHSELKSLFQSLRKFSRPLIDITFHAQLYVLADKYLMSELKDIALHKLHSNLVGTKPTDENINYLVELVLYAYSNTSDAGDIVEGTSDQLRNLVMAYMATHSKEVVKHAAFRHALAAGGSHSADFITLALTRIEK